MHPTVITTLDVLTPDLGADCWIAPTAVLIGRVRLRARVGVFYSAVLGGDVETITIGADTNIQDGRVLHADPGFALPVGARGSVGHNAGRRRSTVPADTHS